MVQSGKIEAGRRWKFMCWLGIAACRPQLTISLGPSPQRDKKIEPQKGTKGTKTDKDQ
jgi:hypothetical protein